jgi:hypothetical protein
MYLICLITLMMCIASLVGIVRSGLELAYPQPPMVDYAIAKPVAPGEVDQPSEEQMAAEREYQQLSSRRYAVINVMGNATMLAIALPLYLYHWRKIRQARAAEES